MAINLEKSLPGVQKVAGSQAVIKYITIANGGSLSSSIDFGTARLSLINMPAAWTAATLTFQVSSDGTTFRNLYMSDGTEYSITVGASQSVIVPLVDFLGIRFLKIRSGTSGGAVNQGADRILELVLVP